MCSASPHSPKLRSSEALGTSSLHAIFYEQGKLDWMQREKVGEVDTEVSQILAHGNTMRVLLELCKV